MKSIIEVISHGFEMTQARMDWAAVLGINIPPPGVSFRNTVTGDEYSYLCGAVGWPVIEASGMLLVLAVDDSYESDPLIRVLEEKPLSTQGSPREILEGILELRKKYGYGLHRDLVSRWYGNPRKCALFGGFVKNNVFLLDPAGHEDPHRFGAYLHAVRDDVTRGLLVLENCPRLGGYLKTIPPDASAVDGEEAFPAVFALGAAIYTLRQHRPWLTVGSPRAYNMDDGFGY